MSTDPTKPLRPPAQPEQPETDPAADAPQAAPPTVRTPAVRTPAVKAPAPPEAGPPQPPARWGQEPPTQAMPKWQAPPPPPPPGGQRAPQTQRDRPPQRPQPQQQWQQPRPPQQQFQQPQPWTEAQPWIEPQDDRPGQWPSPPQQSQAPGQWAQPPQPPAGEPPMEQPRLRRRRRKRRVRRSVMALFTVIVVLILLVIADRVALAVTENEMASQFQQNGFPVKPSVTIQGFPFLTQLAAKDFNNVDISASDVPAGPVTITSVNATLHGLHISSFSSSATARVDQLNATAFVSFGALAAAGGIDGGTGITVAPAGPNTVKISADIGGIFSDSEEAQITTTGPQTISVKVLPNGSALGSVLSSFGSFSFNLPAGVPASLRITGLTLNSQGLTVSASATDATFSK